MSVDPNQGGVKQEGGDGSSKSEASAPPVIIHTSMKGSYDPPEFTADASMYQEYKKRLKRWSRITKVDKKQQAEVVLYHLEKHPSRIQEKIDIAIGDDIIENESGLDKLIEYLDGIYGEDDMTEALSRYKEFIRLRKTKEQTIAEFIAVFEGTYIKAQQSGCEFSDTVLAFNLLEASKLSETDEKFVLTRVDFKKGKQNKDLFEQFKASLKVFQGRENYTSECRIKVDESMKEVLVSEGWVPPEKEKYKQSGGKKKTPYKGRKNPLGKDGKPLRCFQCDSEYHMMDTCKAEKKSKKPKEEEQKTPTMLSLLLQERRKDTSSGNTRRKEEVMVTHDEEELCFLLEDAGIRGVIDTACSKTVAGISWIEKYTADLPPEISEELQLEESSKVYQFGGGEKRSSLGSVKLPTVIGDKKISLSVEVVDAMIPLLIGSNSLETASTILNFQHFTATFFNQEVEMYKVGTGHFCIDLTSDYVDTYINDVENRETEVLEILTALTDLDLSSNDIKKLHHFYGHVPAGRLKSLTYKSGQGL